MKKGSENEEKTGVTNKQTDCVVFCHVIRIFNYSFFFLDFLISAWKPTFRRWTHISSRTK